MSDLKQKSNLIKMVHELDDLFNKLLDLKQRLMDAIDYTYDDLITAVGLAKRGGSKIEAIKIHRAIYKTQLIESKQAVEQLMEEIG